MKAVVDVLGSPALIVHTISMDVKPHWKNAVCVCVCVCVCMYVCKDIQESNTSFQRQVQEQFKNTCIYVREKNRNKHQHKIFFFFKQKQKTHKVVALYFINDIRKGQGWWWWGGGPLSYPANKQTKPHTATSQALSWWLDLSTHPQFTRTHQQIKLSIKY